jgi:hypothetical protein
MRDGATWERARLARISSGFRNSMAFAGGTPAVPGYFRSSNPWACGAHFRINMDGCSNLAG